MSSVTHPKGRLPARVYWFRRGLVLFVALALIVVIAQLLGGNGADPQAAARADKAAPAAARASASATPIGPVAVPTVAPKKGAATAAPRSLAAPDGPCLPSDVGVTPVITKAFAGRPVSIVLQLTSTRPACTFAVSAQTLAVRISSGKDAIWSSQQCPKAIRESSVIARSSAPAVVQVRWNGQRSDENCTISNPWARPGFYHVAAAALGSEPTDAQFELQSPPRPVITRTAKPKPVKRKPAAKPTTTTSKSTQAATPKPSGAVEPDATTR